MRKLRKKEENKIWGHGEIVSNSWRKGTSEELMWLRQEGWGDVDVRGPFENTSFHSLHSSFFFGVNVKNLHSSSVLLSLMTHSSSP